MNGRLYYGSKSLVLCSLHMCQCWVSFNVQQPFFSPPLNYNEILYLQKVEGTRILKK